MPPLPVGELRSLPEIRQQEPVLKGVDVENAAASAGSGAEEQDAAGFVKGEAVGCAVASGSEIGCRGCRGKPDEGIGDRYENPQRRRSVHHFSETGKTMRGEFILL